MYHQTCIASAYEHWFCGTFDAFRFKPVIADGKGLSTSTGFEDKLYSPPEIRQAGTRSVCLQPLICEFDYATELITQTYPLERSLYHHSTQSTGCPLLICLTL